MKKSRSWDAVCGSCRVQQFCLTIWLLCLSVASNAGLVVTLSNDGFDGVIATFEGSGVTGGVGSNQTAQFFNIGEYTTASGSPFGLADTITFAPGISVLLLGISDDLAPNPDDFGFIVDGIISPGTAYSATGSSVVIGLSYTDLIPGVYTSNEPGGIVIEDFTLVIEEIPTPALTCLGASFEAPFNETITLKNKVMKAIPVKMSLVDTDSNIITESDISSPPVVNISYTPGAGVDDSNNPELVPPGLADDGNAFRFNYPYWVINLATKQFTSVGTYEVTAVAGDDSYIIDASSCSGSFIRLP